MVLNGPYNPPRHAPHLVSNYNRRAMSDRVISEGRVVHVHDFPLQPVWLDFQRMGWSAFLLASGLVYPGLLYEFYANFDYIPGCRVTFEMFDETHSYTLSQFSDLLDIPYVEDGFPVGLPRDEMWEALCRTAIPYRTMLRTGIVDDYINTRYTVHNHIIRDNMYHRESGETVLSRTEERLHWCLINDVPVNIANMVASRMSLLHHEPARPLPYGALLTRLFHRIGVIQDGIWSHPISTTPINRASVYDSSSDDSTGPPPISESSSTSLNSRTSSTRSDARSNRRR